MPATGEKEKPGIDGAIMPRMEKASVIIYVDVPSVDEFLRKVVQAGGKAILEKAAIPGIGYSACCVDTEGNVFGLFQGDSSAK